MGFKNNSQRKAMFARMRGRNNPYAICGSRINRRVHPVKYESCVKQVKHRFKKIVSLKVVNKGKDEAGAFVTVQRPDGLTFNVYPHSRGNLYRKAKQHEIGQSFERHLIKEDY